MKAVVKTEPGYDKMELRDVPVPEVYGDRVTIKVAYTGICGSDIHTFKGEYKNPTTPVTLGHEFSGEVVAVGPLVTKFKIGDRVTSETTFETCGECVYCKERDYNLCSNRKGIGTQANGSFAEYVLSREESCHLLADSISYEAAALTEPLACCVHAALEKTEVGARDTVLIFGPGPIGLLLAQVAVAQGATVIMAGITKDKARLLLALKLGVDKVVDTLTDDLEDIVLSMTDGYGADKVFDCSGAVPAVNQGLPLTKKKGDFVQVGLFAEKKNAIDEEAIIQREIAYIGSRSQKPSSWILALDLLAKGQINADEMITKVYDLDDWRAGFEAVMAGNEIKVLVKSN
ncbi:MULTISPECIES: zinc-binding dehydrogenase [Listeria]|uniref:zinc-binding dehydrogenase n=1 Tax=Listeria TaxID=1637 RepID=UPI000B590441|nr:MULTISPECIES: zinc-binding dehydrogenase [Listeria]